MIVTQNKINTIYHNMKEKLNINDLVMWFQLEFPELTQQMKTCEHGHSSPNIFHTEGSIWTHTMMVLLQVENMKFNKLIMIAALLHDVGKPNSVEVVDRQSKEGSELVHKFIGHEGTSVYYAIKPLQKLLENKIITSSEMNDILLLINYHGMLFNFFKDGTFQDRKNIVKKRFYRNPMLFKNLVNLVIADSSGRFYYYEEGRKESIQLIKNTFDDYFFDELFKYSIEKKLEIASTKFENSIIILCGVPCSGKTTWINENINQKNTIIVSRDNILLQYAKIKYGSTTYNECWDKLSKEDHLNIDDMLNDEFKLAISRKMNVVVDMTMLSPKSRRRFLQNQNVSNYYKKAVFFKTNVDDLFERNEARVGRTFSKDLFTDMMKRLIIPFGDEIHELEFV